MAPSAVKKQAYDNAAPHDRQLQPSAGVLDDILGYKLRRAQLATFEQFSRHFHDLELRPAELALLLLLKRMPEAGQAELADLLVLKRANFVALVNRLVRRHLVLRTPVEGDRRARKIDLTPDGLSLLSEAEKRQRSYERKLLEKLGGPGNRALFLDALDRLIEWD
ncbi:MarR family winged helix-turn-helix transcriptional regulator [Neorhizobium sp. DT-125]|uniref:MarR family winged helix-turn-helix transcriptional regulator n=1 Tax=Neorhizobium sp. DT-125 TaxID=3396163 RepID=UPI003F1AB380